MCLFVLVVGSFAGVWIVLGLSGVVAPPVNWFFQVPAWLTLALTPVLVGYSGSLRLLVRRRRVRGSTYWEMFTRKGMEMGRTRE